MSTKINTEFITNELPSLTGTPFSYVTELDMTEDGQPGVVLTMLYGDTKVFQTGFELFTIPLVHAYTSGSLEAGVDYKVESLDGTQSDSYSGEEASENVEESFEGIRTTIKTIIQILSDTGIIDEEARVSKQGDIQIRVQEPDEGFLKDANDTANRLRRQQTNRK